MIYSIKRNNISRVDTVTELVKLSVWVSLFCLSLVVVRLILVLTNVLSAC